MFAIADGREHFYQWDIDRQVVVDDPDITEVHFCNKTDDCSLVVEVNEVAADTLAGQHFSYRTANVPNILLQNDFPIRVYAYCGDGYTKIEKVFKVISRTKPSDYVYTETEVKTYEALEARLERIIETGIDDETVENAITDYLANNPIAVPTKVSAFENDTGYAKKSEIPTIPSSLPANGGNADTVDGMHIKIAHSAPTEADFSIITFVL